MLDIYSIGDINYLVTILNSIAAWAGTSNPAKLASVGAMIGIFVICVQAILHGRAPQFQNFLVAVIFYWFLMGPGVGVTVHDVYSGNTQNVGNVPLGVAVIGSVMSSVGFTITEKMEQMFSTPKMTACFAGSSPVPECGFLSGVRHLGVPAIDLYLPGLNSLPAAQQGNVRKTLLNYIQDCTYTGLNLNEKQIQAIMQNTDPWAAMGYVSDVYGTKTYIPVVDPVDGTNRTCSGAYTQITTFLSGTNFWSYIRDQIRATMGISGDPYVVMQDELNAMATATATAPENVYSVSMAKILHPLFKEGINAEELLKYNMSSGDITAAQAVAQRNEQWYGEKRLFQTTIRPALTFFEGLFYALTPFMVFMIMIVPYGIKMIIRYLQTAIWIQCWMPMMAIVNLFAYMAFYKEFAALKTANVSASSLYGVIATQSSANEWIAQANLLGSMVPALAMVAVYGSSVALTHMAAQLRGGDHWDEKLRVPDIAKTAPLYTYDPTHGAHTTGAPGAAPNLEMGQTLTATEASTHREMETSQAAYRSSVGSVISNSATHTLSGSELTSVGSKIAASSGHSQDYVMRVSNAINQAMGGDETTLRNTAATLAASGGLALAGSGAKATLESIYGENKADRFTEALSAGQEASGAESIHAGFTESVEQDHRENHSSVLAETIGESEDKSLQKSAADMVASEESYARFQQARSTLGANFSNDIVTLGAKVAHNFGHAAALSRIAAGFGITTNNRAFQNLAMRYQNNYGMNRESAYSAARMMMLNEKSQQGNAQAGNALVGFLAGIDSSSGGGGLSLGKTTTNKGVGTSAANVGAQVKDEASRVTGPQSTPDREAIHAGATSIPTADVRGAYDGYVDGVNATGDTWSADIKGAGAGLALTKMQNYLTDRNMASAAYGELNERFGVLNNAIDGVNMALSTVYPSVGGAQAIRDSLLAVKEKFNAAVEAGYDTPGGKNYAAEGERLLQEQTAAWEKMQSGGVFDKVTGGLAWAGASINGFFNEIKAAGESGQLGNVVLGSGETFVEGVAGSELFSGLRQVAKNTLDAETIRQKAYADANRAGLVGEQADLYADVRASTLTFNASNPADAARNSNWNLDSLTSHNWQRDEKGNRVMDETVARTIIYAAGSGVDGPLNLVKGYNVATK